MGREYVASRLRASLTVAAKSNELPLLGVSRSGWRVSSRESTAVGVSRLVRNTASLAWRRRVPRRSEHRPLWVAGRVENEKRTCVFWVLRPIFFGVLRPVFDVLQVPAVIQISQREHVHLQQ